LRRSAVCLDKATASEDASDQVKEFRRRDRARAYLGSLETSGKVRRHLRALARNFAGLAALFGEDAEGKRRGSLGGFIGAEVRRIRQELKRIEEGRNQREARSPVRNSDGGGRR
jgi:hypothetical protein